MTEPGASAGGYGFIGLGNMGAPMAGNIAKAGIALAVYDKEDAPAKAPAGTSVKASLAELAGQAATLFLSVPDGAASMAVARAVCQAPQRITDTIIDLSTTGIAAAREVHAFLASYDIEYVDSPVSGGQAGARAGTITVIWAGAQASLAKHRPALAAMAKNIFHVGDAAGQGQAMKLLNNFLSATALAATTEALLFGHAQGLDLKTMLDVLNVSTGRNTASMDKFPNRVLTQTYDAGFFTALMSKDVKLYMESVAEAGTPAGVGGGVAEIWRRMDSDLPHSDITEIYTWMQQNR